jgi:hypothetical protein
LRDILALDIVLSPDRNPSENTKKIVRAFLRQYKKVIENNRLLRERLKFLFPTLISDYIDRSKISTGANTTNNTLTAIPVSVVHALDGRIDPLAVAIDNIDVIPVLTVEYSPPSSLFLRNIQ